jgi:hypothetical protein
MKLVRFHLNFSTVSEKGNCIEYSNYGEKVKTPDDIRRVIEEAIKIAFPEVA